MRLIGLSEVRNMAGMLSSVDAVVRLGTACLCISSTVDGLPSPNVCIGNRRRNTPLDGKLGVCICASSGLIVGCVVVVAGCNGGGSVDTCLSGVRDRR